MTRSLGTALLPSLLLVASLAPAAAPAVAAAAPAARLPGGGDKVRLTAPPGEVVRSATVDLRGAGQSRGDADRTVRTSGFSMVAVTWRGAAPDVELRTRGVDGWSAWQHAEPLADGPRLTDGRGASDLLWAGPSSAVQVRTEGRRPAELDLVLIDPGHLPGDDTAAPATTSAPRSAAPESAPRPVLHTRKEWGADPTWRNGKPRYLDKLKQVHVHHTATGNDYRRSDVPGILRGIYRYHTHTLGWFDIGYNFLVDRFGRAWVGRSGGADRLVRGAHTLGFNHSSVGVAMIGNLEGRRAWADAVTALVKVAAWKLDRHGRDATGKVTVTSSGSDNYADGEQVELPAIDGHRDTNDTACPGAKLYAKLPKIRTRAQWRIDHW